MALRCGVVAVSRGALTRGGCCWRRAGAGWPRGSSGLVQLKKISRVLPPRDKFVSRHIGPRSKDIEEMLQALGLQVRTAGTGWLGSVRASSGCLLALHTELSVLLPPAHAVLGRTDAKGYPRGHPPEQGPHAGQA